jgi:hypothetical protein
MKQKSILSGDCSETQTTTPALDDVQANWQRVIRFSLRWQSERAA